MDSDRAFAMLFGPFSERRGRELVLAFLVVLVTPADSC